MVWFNKNIIMGCALAADCHSRSASSLNSRDCWRQFLDMRFSDLILYRICLISMSTFSGQISQVKEISK